MGKNFLIFNINRGMRGKMEFKIGNVVEITIEKNIFGGEGMGHIGEMVIFVPESLQGDKVKVEIISVKKGYCRGIIKEITSPSAYRAEPVCPMFDKCGGCDFMMAAYSEQLNLKRNMVKEVIERVGKISDQSYILHSVTGAESLEESLYYRNKVIQPFAKSKGKIISGFYKKRTHDVVDNESCLIQSDLSNKIIKKLKEIVQNESITVYDEKSHSGYLRNVMVRVNKKNDAMVVLICNGSVNEKIKKAAVELSKLFKEIKSIYVSVNTKRTNVVLGSENQLILGEKFIVEELFGLKFNISPLSFFQVNLKQTEKLYSLAIGLISDIKNKIILDAYSGTGTIGMLAAQKAKYVYCVEENRHASEDGVKSSKSNGITNIEFINKKMENAIYDFENKEIKIDTIIFDPPRSGISENILNECTKWGINEIVYISCNASTFARDMYILKNSGFRLEEVYPVDMFPHTNHIEIAAKIVREEVR